MIKNKKKTLLALQKNVLYLSLCCRTLSILREALKARGVGSGKKLSCLFLKKNKESKFVNLYFFVGDLLKQKRNPKKVTLTSGEENAMYKVVSGLKCRLSLTLFLLSLILPLYYNFHCDIMPT